jgi:hypothetical protein
VSPAACLLPRSVPRGATAVLDNADSGDLVITSDGERRLAHQRRVAASIRARGCYKCVLTECYKCFFCASLQDTPSPTFPTLSCAPATVRYGTRLGDLKENWFLLFSN